MHVVFQFLRWSVDAMALGVYPRCGHDALGMEDWRLEQAGSRMTFRIAVMFIKADWAELAHNFGFLAWNDGIRP